MNVALAQTRRLEELEVVIERGMSTFVEVGEALLEIRGSRLYRDTDGTFEGYCRRRWGFTARRANHLMDAAEIGTVVPIATERQARELVPLLREQGPAAVAEVWSTVIERAERDETPITGPVIRNAVRDRIRGMAAESEAELQEATAHWTEEERDLHRPEVMRQRGELMRLVHDLAALPEPAAFARLHEPYLSAGFVAELVAAGEWLDGFRNALEAMHE